MNVVTMSQITSQRTDQVEDIGTMGLMMGEKVTGSSARNSYGFRKFIYVHNSDSAAWAVGNIVRQECVNPNGTEGTIDSGEAESTTLVIENDAHGEDVSTVGYGWKVWGETGEVGDAKVSDTNSITLISALTTALTDTYKYGVYRPWDMVKVTKNTTLVVAGFAMAAVAAGAYGWMQVYGFGLGLYADDSDTDTALTFGKGLEVSTDKDGCIMGIVDGSDEDTPFGFALATQDRSNGTSFLCPIFINTMMSW